MCGFDPDLCVDLILGVCGFDPDLCVDLIPLPVVMGGGLGVKIFFVLHRLIVFVFLNVFDFLFLLPKQK